MVEQYLVRQAERELAHDILQFFQVSVDTNWESTTFRIAVEFNRELVKRFDIHVSYKDNTETLMEKINLVMQGNLSLVGQMHFVRLHKVFPNSIRDVTVVYNADKHEKIIHVEFKNGHVAEAPEAEAKTDLFIARCSMLFDLPPR